MGRDVQTQLRITAWPQSPLLLPKLERVRSRVDRELGVIAPDVSDWNLVSPFEGESIALAGETYLHLRQIDLDDVDSIERFVDRFGPLGGREAAYELRQSQNEALMQSYGSLNFRNEHARKERALRSAILATHPSTAQLDEEAWKHIVASPLSTIPSFVETVTEFRYAAGCLHETLRTLWLALSHGGDPFEAPLA